MVSLLVHGDVGFHAVHGVALHPRYIHVCFQLHDYRCYGELHFRHHGLHHKNLSLHKQIGIIKQN